MAVDVGEQSGPREVQENGHHLHFNIHLGPEEGTRRFVLRVKGLIQSSNKTFVIARET